MEGGTGKSSAWSMWLLIMTMPGVPETGSCEEVPVRRAKYVMDLDNHLLRGG
jgi:hypothetical protein